MIEKALHIESVSQLQPLPPGFTRLYFGNETCERLIPSTEDIQKAKQFCKEKEISFSLVTPFCTDAGLSKVRSLLSLLSEGDELIANDFGVLKIAHSSKALPVAGRLLNRQSRDPRIASFRDFPPDMLRHLSMSQASSPSFLKILSSFGARRVGLDNLLQGISTDLSKTGFSGSLYFPIVFISATRMCLLAQAGRISASNKAGIIPCSKECSQFRFRLKNSCFPKPLFLKGNALFFENASLPKEKELDSLGIDRLVSNSGMME